MGIIRRFSFSYMIYVLVVAFGFFRRLEFEVLPLRALLESMFVSLWVIAPLMVVEFILYLNSDGKYRGLLSSAFSRGNRVDLHSLFEPLDFEETSRLYLDKGSEESNLYSSKPSPQTETINFYKKTGKNNESAGRMKKTDLNESGSGRYTEQEIKLLSGYIEKVLKDG